MLRQVTVKNGRLEGIPAADPRITVYKGIPFAAPPVGALRWQAPQPAKDWEGVLRCDAFGPIAVQDTPGLGDPEFLYNKEWHVDSALPISEDCLYLNVWTPARKADEKLPVMFWIFGGGLQVGYPSEMEFDGERMARRGVILVSVNYRLNVFGFLAHPEIPANIGLLDQLAGMKWVKENIAAFGGDPDNVTIFGQSAGAGSTMAHLTSPMSEGYFHKAIPQSGGGLLQGFSHGHPDMAKAGAYGKGFIDFLGVSSIDEARQLDTKTVFEKARDYPAPADWRLKWGMVIDGKFLMRHVRDSVVQGKMHRVPILSGFTSNEFFITPQEPLEQTAKQMFGDQAGRYLEICGNKAEAGRFNSFELGNRVWYKKCAELGYSPLYLYEFNPPMPGDNAGSFHSSDLWFTFETLAKCWRPFKGRHYDLARIMCNYWTNFAKYGNPNGNDVDGNPMPTWDAYTTEQPHAMYFDLDPRMCRAPLSDIMSFLVDYEYRNL